MQLCFSFLFEFIALFWSIIDLLDAVAELTEHSSGRASDKASCLRHQAIAVGKTFIKKLQVEPLFLVSYLV